MGFTTVGGATFYIPEFTRGTNLGPLTTTAFPPDCLSNLFDFNTPGLGEPWTVETQGCALKTCCPSGNAYTEPWAWMTSYYSPGVCPSEYRPCQPPPSPSALSSAAGETIAFCCPTNYLCPDPTPGNIFYACGSLLSTATSVIVLDNIFNQRTLSTRTFTLASGMVNSWQLAYPIQIRWKAEDFVTTSTTSTSFPSATTNSASNEPGSNSQLSPGAIIGIALGGFFCLAIAATVGICIVIRRRRFRERRSTQPTQLYFGDVPTVQQHKPELYNSAMVVGELSTEATPRVWSELDGRPT